MQLCKAAKILTEKASKTWFQLPDIKLIYTIILLLSLVLKTMAVEVTNNKTYS